MRFLQFPFFLQSHQKDYIFVFCPSEFIPGDVGYPGTKGPKGLVGFPGIRGKNGESGERVRGRGPSTIFKQTPHQWFTNVLVTASNVCLVKVLPVSGLKRGPSYCEEAKLTS